MGKYIIKLERGETAYKTVNSNGKPMIQLLAPTPYTEPDLEQVRKEAYERGAEDMRKALRLLIDCDDDCLTISDIFHTFREGSYHAVVRKHPAMEIIEKIRQYEQRQEEQIQVGDEVKGKYGTKAGMLGIVTRLDDALQNYNVVWSDGSTICFTGYRERGDVVKTGRHFPEIAEVLQKMRGVSRMALNIIAIVLNLAALIIRKESDWIAILNATCIIVNYIALATR